ncbi:MAG: hypothetical protein GY884_09430 [Proteobacteria bacterium]|nr:hypothetical protein [Pseudomonadota bacterium]
MLWLLGCPQPEVTPPDSPAEVIDTADTGDRELPFEGAWEIEALATPLRGPEDAVRAGVTLVVEDLDQDGLSELLVADDLHRVQSEGTLDGAIWIGSVPTDEVLLDELPFVFGSRHESRAGGAMTGFGDGRVAIGARYHNPDLTTIQGAVWILSGPAEGNLDHVALRLDGQEDHELGTAVAVLDANADGELDVVAGAPGAEGTGIAWIALGPHTASTLTDESALGLRGVAPGAAGGGLAAGDLDGDGLDDLVVGAPDLGESYEGAIYVQLGPISAGSLLDADHAWQGDLPYDRLGAYLSAGDADGDGRTDLLVGIPRYAAEDKGRAVLVTALDASLADAPVIQGELPDARTGAAIAVLGDLDEDGHPELVVGAPGHSGGGEDGGAVHVLYGPFEGTRSPDGAELLAETPGDELGSALAAPGDIDGDGRLDLLIGAPGGSDAWWLSLP